MRLGAARLAIHPHPSSHTSPQVRGSCPPGTAWLMYPARRDMCASIVGYVHLVWSGPSALPAGICVRHEYSNGDPARFLPRVCIVSGVTSVTAGLSVWQCVAANE